jgi:sugar phosphate isomerase/epimerase
MRIGIFAKAFGGTDPARVFAKIAQAGYETAQYNLACSGLPSMPDVIPGGTAVAVASAAAEAGVEVAAVSGTYNMIHPDPAVREAGLARLERLAAACRAMTAPLITLCTGTRNAADPWRHHPDNADAEAWRDLLASMERAVQIAEEHGVDLGVEPELANVVSSAGRARALLDEIGSPRLKIVLDPANLFEVETPERRRVIIAQAVDLLADRIAMAHAKDRTAIGAFTTAGRGVIDFRHFTGLLRETGFRGPLVTHGLEARDAPEVAAFLRDVLAGADTGRPA